MAKLLKNLNRKDLLYVVICVTFIVFQVYLDLRLPDFMSNITVLVESNVSNMGKILIQGTYMMLCALGSLVSSFFVCYLSSYVSSDFAKNLRKKVFEKIQKFSLENIKHFKTSSLITRTTNDITNIEMILSIGMQMLIKAPITAVWAVLKILNKNFSWSMVTGVAVVFLLSVVAILMVLVIPKFKLIQKLVDKLNESTREQLTGIRVIRAFNAEKFHEKRFEKSNNKLTNTQIFAQRTMAIMSPVMLLVMNLTTLAIYFIGTFLISNSVLSAKVGLFGDMVVFSSYAIQAIMSFLMLAIIFVMYPRAAVSATRINEVLDKKESIVDGTKDIKVTNDCSVEFKNVYFKYPDSDEYILKDISFKVSKGQTFAFVGSTGSGKSTLINLIMRFYDVTKGQILIDGVDIKDYKLSDLYNKIGYVPQKAVIFNGTVNYNIAYGKSDNIIDNDKIKKASKIAIANEFVEKMSNKYDSKIAARGTNISGGQKQRLAIARAVARDPKIYIFDDSFSALDYKTDYLLRNNLKKKVDALKIIVAQRIGTILNADQIMVLDKGKCVGKGTHQELMKKCRIYQEIAHSQL